MDRLSRKIVHSLANAYNLSSKSSGSGQARYTTLFKTSYTSTNRLSERKINAILKQAGCFNSEPLSTRRNDSSYSGGGAKKHRDGHIVGGDAKEIEEDNRGRVMLEKLGWKSGMGLGAEGMGMKVPLVAVVKTGKSGLR